MAMPVSEHSRPAAQLQCDFLKLNGRPNLVCVHVWDASGAVGLSQRALGKERGCHDQVCLVRGLLLLLLLLMDAAKLAYQRKPTWVDGHLTI